MMKMLKGLWKKDVESVLNIRTQHQMFLYVETLLINIGYVNVKPTSTKGIDFIADKQHICCAFKAVHSRKPCGIEALQSLYSEMVPLGAKVGVVITSGEFTDEAINYGKLKNLNLWDETYLQSLERQF